MAKHISKSLGFSIRQNLFRLSVLETTGEQSDVYFGKWTCDVTFSALQALKISIEHISGLRQ